jgi:tripartite-type tricarboxylate transporter receptor subunit TctC
LTYICNINQSNSIAITPKDRPWKTWAEFIDHAKKNPGKLSFGSTGTWGISHVRITAIMNSFGVKLVHVPYGGGNAVNQAVIRGEVDFGISSPSYTIPIVQSGEVNGLAVVSYRIKSLPDVPSFDDLGIKIKMPMWRGVVGPPGMPKEITDYLQKQFAALVKDKSFVSTMKKLGEDIVFTAGDEWYEVIKNQYQTWGATTKSIAEEEKQKKK